MFKLSQSIKFIRMAASVVLLPLLVWSCQLVTDDFDYESDSGAGAKQFINVTISVSASHSPFTRANSPLGGEDGDGREEGIDTRENEVDGLTIIFYRDAANTSAGINATAEDAAATTIDLAVYYSVSRDDSHAAMHQTGHDDEVFYTTGDRHLDVSLNPDYTYHLLLVANANLTGSITAGSTTLAQVRDMVRSAAYTGTGIATDASKFIMSSEEDHSINFSSSTYDVTNNRRTFKLDNIHVERLAARIDFLARGAAYSTDYDHNGYVYDVGADDHFVLTSITPFNLNMGAGGEYIFKRTNDTAPYLADETTTNWVIDPYRADRSAAVHPVWMVSRLTDVETSMTGDYNVSMEGQQANKLSIGGYDDIILAYPKENTLTPSSPLYYHATGIAFEGYYYYGSNPVGERCTFFHYLRHQGENEKYEALVSPIDPSPTPGSLAMNYGIVRNNIYRVSIEGINVKDRTIVIKIEEEKWRHVDNPTIYI